MIAMMPRKKEWQVRVDLNELATSFKCRTEEFWSQPRRGKVKSQSLKLEGIQTFQKKQSVMQGKETTVRKKSRRTSNETREVEHLKGLENDILHDQGETQYELPPSVTSPRRPGGAPNGGTRGTVRGSVQDPARGSRALSPMGPTSSAGGKLEQLLAQERASLAPPSADDGKLPPLRGSLNIPTGDAPRKNSKKQSKVGKLTTPREGQQMPMEDTPEPMEDLLPNTPKVFANKKKLSRYMTSDLSGASPSGNRVADLADLGSHNLAIA